MLTYVLVSLVATCMCTPITPTQKEQIKTGLTEVTDFILNTCGFDDIKSISNIDPPPQSLTDQQKKDVDRFRKCTHFITGDIKESVEKCKGNIIVIMFCLLY